MKRLVTELPLRELWDDHGPFPTVVRGDLKTEEIRDLLKAGPVQFVVANLGEPLRWIPETECFAFWKSDVRHHVADTESVCLDDLDGGFVYWASLWEPVSGRPPVVLLSKCD